MKSRLAQSIAVIGCGFVGETVASFLEDSGHEVFRIDPKLGPETITDYHQEYESVIICLPAPTTDKGVVDDSLILDVLNKVREDAPVLLKSTVTPDLVISYPSNVTYNPEFLRASSASEDFENQHTFILGTDDEWHFKYWSDVFADLPSTCEFHQTDRYTASMIKYTHNAWLATKVAFFHDLYRGSKLTHDQYDCATDILARFENIGPSHMSIPNSNGGLGYGGMCFPKDTVAFHTYLQDNFVLEATIKTNNHISYFNNETLPALDRKKKNGSPRND